MKPGPLHAPTAETDTAPEAAPSPPTGAAVLAARLEELRAARASTASAARPLRTADGAPFHHRRLLASPGWHREAEHYEERLGAVLAASPEVRRAALTAVLRLAHVLSSAFTWERAAGAFFKDDATSAGQVGTAGDPAARLLQWADPGSAATTRELMTAFYNAAYYKYGPQPEPPADDGAVSFKTVLHRAVLDGDMRLPQELGLDTQALRTQRQHLTGGTRKVLGALPDDLGRLFGKDVFALGNLTLQHGVGTARSMGRSQRGRLDRPDPDTAPGKRTPRDYRDRGTPLSDAELAHAWRSTTPLRVQGLRLDDDGRLLPAEHEVDRTAIWAAMTWPREQGPEFPLPWAPGQALFVMDPEDPWYRKHHERGAPLVAGISGTTTRMLSAHRWLRPVAGGGQQSAEREFFLAVAAWMLTARDHSLYEILRGAKAAGLPGITASSKDVARMYRDFDAFVRSTLPSAALPELPYATLYERTPADVEDGGFVTMRDETVRTARRRQRALLSLIHISCIRDRSQHVAHRSGTHDGGERCRA